MAIGFAPALRGSCLALSLLGSVLGSVVPTSAEEARGLLPFASRMPPPIALPRLGGGTTTIGAPQGRATLVHFFATWCEPCRAELASLDRLRADAAGRGLAILAVSVAEPETRLARFFERAPASFAVLIDGDRAASRAWGIDTLPSTLVLDGQGRPRLEVSGDLDWQDPHVRAALDDLLDDIPAAADGTAPSHPQDKRP